MLRKLRRQVRIVLHDATGAPYLLRSARYHRGRRLTYVADVVYEERTAEHDDRVTVIEDQKGYDTPVSKTKRAIVERIRREESLNGAPSPAP